MDTPERRFHDSAMRTRRRSTPPSNEELKAQERRRADAIMAGDTSYDPAAHGRRVEVCDCTGPGVRVETLSEDPRDSNIRPEG